MSDPGGAFFHDLIEGVVIWEDDGDVPNDVVKVPAEAQQLETAPPPHDAQEGHEIDLAPSDHLIADAHVVEAHHDADSAGDATDHAAGADHAHGGDEVA